MGKNDKSGGTTSTLSLQGRGSETALAAAITHDSTGSGQASTASTPSPTLPLQGGGSVMVAYHAGPGEIGFCGNSWQRGVVQTITPAEWHAMQMRADFEEFNFIEEK